MLFPVPEKKMKKIRSLVQVCRRGSGAGRASVTLECALVLPLFFMAVLTVTSFMNALRIQTENNLNLSNRARALSAAAGAAVNEAGEDDTWIDLQKKETFRYPFGLPGVPSLKIAVRARVRPFCGCKGGIAGEGNGFGEGDRTVYVTDNEAVWHSHPDCTHLDLSVFRTSRRAAESMRNEYGRRYRKCPGFPDDYKGPVYLTRKGDYYYPNQDYPGLTRHVHVVRKGDAGDLKQCDRCAARDAAGAAA